MVAEEFLSGLNANIFLREFSFDKNQFRLSSNEEVEFADHVIWIDDLLFIFQVKERENDVFSTEENENKWFTKKVLGKATKQIRDSVQYLFQQKNISIQNQRGYKFELTTDSIATIIDIIGNKQRMLAGITTTQVLDGGILPVGYEGHMPLPSPNPKSHLWCCGKHLSQCDNV
jgi:hypothetical protein